MLPDCLQRWWHVLQCSKQGYLQACPPCLQLILDHFTRRQSRSQLSSSRRWLFSTEFAERWRGLTAAIELLNCLTATLIQMWNLA